VPPEMPEESTGTNIPVADALKHAERLVRATRDALIGRMASVLNDRSILIRMDPAGYARELELQADDLADAMDLIDQARFGGPTPLTSQPPLPM